jgi:hypothetical protein
VQWSVKFFRLSDPAGTTGVFLSGFRDLDTGARPPSPLIWAFVLAAAVMAIALEAMNALRPLSGVSFLDSVFAAFFELFLLT